MLSLGRGFKSLNFHSILFCAVITRVRMTSTEDTAMRNKFLILTLSLIFTFQLTGCSLFSSSSDETETATVETDEQGSSELDDFSSDDFESGEFDPQAMAEGGGDEVLAAEGADVEVEDNFGFESETDAYSDDDYGASAQASTEDFISDDSFGSGADASSEDTAGAGVGDDSLFADEGGLPADPMTDNQEQDLFAQDTTPTVDTPAFQDPGFGGDSFDQGEPMSDGPKLVPVKKMKAAAYKRAGANMNRLYVARAGDTLVFISRKIYSGQRSEEDLLSYNPHFRGRDLKVGDKIYYESPTNPNDTTMKTYYEDLNLAPQYYTTQEGENIRAVAKTLLGDDRSWMEIWATNENLESKGKVSGGIQIRYWPDGVDTQMAENTTKPMPVAEPSPEPQEVVETIADSESADLDFEEDAATEPTEVAQLDEPKPFEDASGIEEDFTPPPAAGMASPPAPPKPTMAPPAPPAPRAQFDKPTNLPVPSMMDAGEMVADDSMIMGALGGLLILAAIIMLIFIRRNRAKRVNFSQTQI